MKKGGLVERKRSVVRNKLDVDILYIGHEKKRRDDRKEKRYRITSGKKIESPGAPTGLGVGEGKEKSSRLKKRERRS